MQLSVTAVTARRLLGKALTRLAEPIENLKRSLADVSTEGWRFAVLQVAIVDQPESHVVRERTPRGSQLLQIAVGLPQTLEFKPEQDSELLAAIGDQVIKAVKEAGLQENVRAEASRRCNEWKSSIYSQLGRSVIH